MSQVWIVLSSVLCDIWVGFISSIFQVGPVEVPVVDFGKGNISTEAKTKRQRRSRSARISRRLVPLARSASPSTDFSGRDHSRTLLEQAFDDSMHQLKWEFLHWCSTAVPQFRCFCFRPLFRRSCHHADQCDRSPAGQSLSFGLCRGAGTNSWPHCDELVLLVFIVIFCFLSLILFVVHQSFLLTHMIFLSLPNLSRTLAVHMTGWCFEPVGAGRAEAVPCWSSIGRHQRHRRQWERYGWTPSKIAVQKDIENEENLGGQRCWEVFCDWAHRCFHKTQSFLLPSFRKDVSVLSHGHQKTLRHFQGSKNFPRDKRLRLEMPGWKVLHYDGNAMNVTEVEWQREKIMRAPLVVRDREYPFSEDVIVGETGAVDPNLEVMAKVFSLIEVLRLGGSYELVYPLWAQFILSAVRVNVDVTWSCDEVLVSIYICPVLSTW